MADRMWECQAKCQIECRDVGQNVRIYQDVCPRCAKTASSVWKSHMKLCGGTIQRLEEQVDWSAASLQNAIHRSLPGELCSHSREDGSKRQRSNRMSSGPGGTGASPFAQAWSVLFLLPEPIRSFTSAQQTSNVFQARRSPLGKPSSIWCLFWSWLEWHWPNLSLVSLLKINFIQKDIDFR